MNEVQNTITQLIIARLDNHSEQLKLLSSRLEALEKLLATLGQPLVAQQPTPPTHND